MTSIFYEIKNNINVDYDSIHTKIKEEKIALEMEEINIKKTELELKKRKIEYETKKFDDKIEKENKKQEQKYFKEHKCKFKKILEELLNKHEKQRITLEFISDKLKKTNNNCSSIKKKSLLQEFNDWFKEGYGQRKIPKDFPLYNLMIKKFGLPDSTRGWIGIEFVRDDDEGLL